MNDLPFELKVEIAKWLGATENGETNLRQLRAVSHEWKDTVEDLMTFWYRAWISVYCPPKIGASWVIRNRNGHKVPLQLDCIVPGIYAPFCPLSHSIPNDPHVHYVCCALKYPVPEHIKKILRKQVKETDAYTTTSWDGEAGSKKMKKSLRVHNINKMTTVDNKYAEHCRHRRHWVYDPIDRYPDPTRKIDYFKLYITTMRRNAILKLKETRVNDIRSAYSKYSAYKDLCVDDSLEETEAILNESPLPLRDLAISYSDMGINEARVSSSGASIY